MTWIFNAFGSRSGNLDEVVRRAPRYANRDRLPIMLIATAEDEPAGCVVLRETDLEGWEHVGPWLASLYVSPDYRGRGVGSLLTRSVENLAAKLGYRELYLFTPDAQGLYQRLGWESLSEIQRQDHTAWVMRRRLSVEN